MKSKMNLTDLCDGIHNINMIAFAKMIQDMKFDEKPDYEKLRACFS